MKSALFAGLLTLSAATAAFAQTTPPPANGTPPQTGGSAQHPHELRGDTNHDGFISKSEWRARGDELFNEIDANHDGKISPEEMHAHREKERAEFQQRRSNFGSGFNGTPPAGAPAGTPPATH